MCVGVHLPLPSGARLCGGVCMLVLHLWQIPLLEVGNIALLDMVLKRTDLCQVPFEKHQLSKGSGLGTAAQGLRQQLDHISEWSGHRYW